MPNSQRKKPPILLMSWKLILDWTGEAESKIEVSAQGLGRKGEDAVKSAFGGLLEKAGIMKAVQGVIGIVFGTDSQGMT